MPLEAQLQALTLPSGTEFPGTPQELLELIEQYMAITGLNPFNGINYGPSTPDAGNRDRPWFKTTNTGSPIGWFSWDGSAWTAIPLTMPTGPTADRPTPPAEGQQYFDTTIHAALIFERSQWRTVSGVPGDIKFVKAATIEEAITWNPGWVQDPDSPGRVIGAAGDNNTGLTARAYGDATGAETVTLTEEQMPVHTHAFGQPQRPRWQADGNAASGSGNLVGYTTGEDDEATEAAGGTTPVDVMQPTIFYWALLKQ